MERIASSLARHFEVVLVGKKTKDTPPLLKDVAYTVFRLNCLFSKGKLQYIEFNIRLFFFLCFKKMNALCAVDLDTILPCYLISKWRKIPHVYDAHELFTEMKEVVTRPFIHRVWLTVERLCVPSFPNGYTVSQSIADEFHRRYQVKYEIIKNLPLLTDEIPPVSQKRQLIYQGAINEARGLEVLIPAMKEIETELHIYGRGNFEENLDELICQNQVMHKVFVHKPVSPDELRKITKGAYIGINLVENTGLNQYYSLANKFFDYIHADIPQVTMKYPEYEAINKLCTIAVLIEELSTHQVAEAINTLLSDEKRYIQLRENCLIAKQRYNWQKEEEKLIGFYNKLIP